MHPSWLIGDIRITSVFEVELTYPLEVFLNQPRITIDQHREWMAPFVTDEGLLRMPVQALLVQADEQRVVVDTCIGNGRDYGERMAMFNHLDTPFLANLAQCGFTRDNVDVVITTHLHIDHVGWNTIEVGGRIEPTFPNARYVMSAPDVDHYRDRPGLASPFAFSIAPVIDAGLADVVAPPHRVSPSITVVPTPGHTPGHMSVRLESNGEVAYITGDMMHSPIQFAHPEWRCMADTDPEQALRSREWLIEETGNRPRRVIGTHFPSPTVGRVVRGSDGFWRFVG